MTSTASPTPAKQPRDYQVAAIDRARAAFLAGRRAVLIVSPTGSGKSLLAALIAQLTIARGNTVAIVAPRIEILGQLAIEARDLGIPVRTIHADHDDGPADAPLVVASIWTVSLPRWIGKLQPQFIIIDECHRALAERSYGVFIAANPSARLLGLTATPARSDLRGLSPPFDELIVATSTAELTRRGNLVPCRVIVPAGAGNGLALPVVDAYQRHAAGRRTIVFAASIAHGKQIVADLTAIGIAAALVTGKTPDMARAESMRAFGAGSLTVLVNVACFVEGLDVPACSAAIFARKFTAIGPYLQAIGRTLRPAPDKQDSLIVDLLGSALEHGPPTLEHPFSLTGRGIRSTVIKDQIRQCQTCGSISLAGAPQCEYCGAEFPVRRAALPTSDRRGLVELDPTYRPEKREFVVTIKSKYHGVCVACRQAYARGDEIRYATVGRTAKHVRCPVV
ncbi:MAG TPA: DEAD/DEAH box helicase, partial [Mycobacterium sp.]|nr:DEAD/DEAH box helicase [Mycobacterium sp.]